jgi:transposase-like protein
MSQRKHLSPQQKVIMLREHLENQVPLSELSEKYDVNINLLYRWKKELFEGAAEIFTAKQKKLSASETRAIDRLTDKLRDKDKLIAELVQDNIELKKSLNGAN